MSEEKIYCISIPNISNRSTSTFLGKSSGCDLHSESTYLRGEMFFDSELVKNEKIEKHYRDGLLVGKVDFYLNDAEDIEDCQARIEISESDLGYKNFIQEVEMVIGCTKEVFEELKNSRNNGNEVRVKFEAVEWKKEDSRFSFYEYSSKCKVIEIEFTSVRKNVNWFENCRIRHIENFLLTNFCGGWTEGQIPTICKEFAKAFADKSLFDSHEEILTKVFALIISLKLNLEIKKSKLREEIEGHDDLELAKLFTLNGDEFYLQFAKVAETDKKKVLIEYNKIWEKINAEDVFKDGYTWNNHELPSLAEEYLNLQSLNSPTLNKILVDGLIKKDIFDISSHYRYSEKMSSAAILSVINGVYNKSEVEIKDKSFKEVLALWSAKSVGWWLGTVISGLFIWWITSLIVGDSELGHYVLFGTIFSSSLIVQALTHNKMPQAIKDNMEEYNFYILRDMCLLHKQAVYMDSKLLRHLMYKIEERGVQMSQYIYKILNKVA